MTRYLSTLLPSDVFLQGVKQLGLGDFTLHSFIFIHNFMTHDNRSQWFHMCMSWQQTLAAMV